MRLPVPLLLIILTLIVLVAALNIISGLFMLVKDKGRDIATLMKNLSMMQTVCSALEKSGCGHLVYFSSDAVYDSGESNVSEETPASPPDLYGVMHYTREIMARSLADIPVLVLRAQLPPEDRSMIDFASSPTWPGLANEFKQGREIYYPDCTHFIPMQIPDEVVRVLQQEIESWRK